METQVECRKIKNGTFSLSFSFILAKIIDRFKYLGIIIDEYLNYDVTAQILSESAGRALGDFGRSCTKYRRHQLMLRFWSKLIHMDVNRLTKHIFNYDYHHCTRNWCSEVKHIFQFFYKVELVNNRNECDIDEN